jgi:hypothetical protein
LGKFPGLVLLARHHLTLQPTVTGYPAQDHKLNGKSIEYRYLLKHETIPKGILASQSH